MQKPLSERFLGGVASFDMYRPPRIVRLGDTSYRGYGFYVTDRRIIGVRTRKAVFRANLPAYIVMPIWVVVLVSQLAYYFVLHAQHLPPPSDVVATVLFGSFMALAIFDLVLFQYATPRLAEKRIQREKAMSMEDVERIAKDVEISRTGISEIIIKPKIVRIAMINGENYTFIYTVSPVGFDELVLLLKGFCALQPPIRLEG